MSKMLSARARLKAAVSGSKRITYAVLDFLFYLLTASANA
jgi:hypothetical protein